MTDLNVMLAYFLSVLGVSAFLGLLLRRRGGRLAVLAELLAAFSLAACRLEVRSMEELGEWAGVGPDVTFTVLFLTLLAHAACWPVVSSNPSVNLLHFLLQEAHLRTTLLRLLLQLAGAHLAWLSAGHYWALELTDMHMIKSLMGSECSTVLRTSLLLGSATEAVCSLTFHLLLLALQRRSALLQVPLLALTLTLLSYAGKTSHTHTHTHTHPNTPLICR